MKNGRFFCAFKAMKKFKKRIYYTLRHGTAPHLMIKIIFRGRGVPIGRLVGHLLAGCDFLAANLSALVSAYVHLLKHFRVSFKLNYTRAPCLLNLFGLGLLALGSLGVLLVVASLANTLKVAWV